MAIGAAIAQSDYGDGDVSHQTNIVRPSPMLTPDGKPDRLDFGGGLSDTKGWVRPNGEWQIQSTVQHRGLSCATYQVGARFGTGNPGCTDVQWSSASTFVTRETQCNSASLMHSGGAVAPELASDFSQITCVDRLIKCSGNCD